MGISIPTSVKVVVIEDLLQRKMSSSDVFDKEGDEEDVDMLGQLSEMCSWLDIAKEYDTVH